MSKSGFSRQRLTLFRSAAEEVEMMRRDQGSRNAGGQVRSTVAIASSALALTTPSSTSLVDDARPRTRLEFVCDVLVLQIKLIIGSVLSFVLGPATLAAAGLDLLFKSGSHGSRFYRVLAWGQQADEGLKLYSALHKRYETIDMPAEVDRRDDDH